MIDVRLDLEVCAELVDRLVRDAEALLDVLDEADRELSLVLVSDADMRPLNQHWRGKDSSTDVLSFPQGPGPVLGDIVISVETAARQAEERGHSLELELRVLLVHGLCHLRGFDHETPAEAGAMREAEQVLLRQLTAPGEPVPSGLVLAAGVAAGGGSQ